MSPADVNVLKHASGGRVSLTVCDITADQNVKAWATIRREFEMNVFGALSVINAFLPELRKARGRIVQVSTWTASLPLPFNGPSGASKAPMEVFAAVYRGELKRFVRGRARRASARNHWVVVALRPVVNLRFRGADDDRTR